MVLRVKSIALRMVKVATILFNYALGFSALHALFVNTLLLPRALRPSPTSRSLLFLCFLFFSGVSTLGVMEFVKNLQGRDSIDYLYVYASPLYVAVGVAGAVGYGYLLSRQRAAETRTSDG